MPADVLDAGMAAVDVPTDVVRQLETAPRGEAAVTDYGSPPNPASENAAEGQVCALCGEPVLALPRGGVEHWRAATERDHRVQFDA